MELSKSSVPVYADPVMSTQDKNRFAGELYGTGEASPDGNRHGGEVRYRRSRRLSYFGLAPESRSL